MVDTLVMKYRLTRGKYSKYVSVHMCTGDAQNMKSKIERARWLKLRRLFMGDMEIGG